MLIHPDSSHSTLSICYDTNNSNHYDHWWQFVKLCICRLMVSTLLSNLIHDNLWCRFAHEKLDLWNIFCGFLSELWMSWTAVIDSLLLWLLDVYNSWTIKHNAGCNRLAWNHSKFIHNSINLHLSESFLIHNKSLQYGNHCLCPGVRAVLLSTCGMMDQVMNAFFV